LPPFNGNFPGEPAQPVPLGILPPRSTEHGQKTMKNSCVCHVQERTDARISAGKTVDRHNWHMKKKTKNKQQTEYNKKLSYC